MHAANNPFPRFRFRDRRNRVRHWGLRGGPFGLEIRTRPAGLYDAQGLRTAGDDAGPCERRIAYRRICPRAAPLSSGRRHPGPRQGGVHLRRGQEFLHPRRCRSGRHCSRPNRVPSRRQACPRRLDHHPAGRQEFSVNERAVLRAQDPGGASLVPDRGRLFQGQDSRTLSQRNLSWARELRRRRRGAELLRQVRA